MSKIKKSKNKNKNRKEIKSKLNLLLTILTRLSNYSGQLVIKRFVRESMKIV